MTLVDHSLFNFLFARYITTVMVVTRTNSISERTVYFTNWACDCLMLIIRRTDIYIVYKKKVWSSLLPACSNNKLTKGKKRKASRQMATSLKLRVNIHSVIRMNLNIHQTSLFFSFLIFNWSKFNRNFNQLETYCMH
jgi:hypothetical protein